MKTFTQKLEELIESAHLIIANSLVLIGEESRHSNQIIIPIRKEELQFNLDNGRWLEEIGSVVIDNKGYQYSLSFLDDEQVFSITDHIMELGKIENLNRI
ncbi:hypothetical protein [Chryseobacterium sp. ISL-6]|uniref:hypothetical protein n=1 Tax=Chryseobacterium sp. ISL-6 TaxID=2819143 RepID=UPI001BE7FE38|nr:hypothetical protein [Chryseobacterium sp. ISL-6]MBT2621248.1 hypothetical protein [Chryseobacterium sp. ISL-6]